MSMIIVSKCIRCGACELECPQKAITPGDEIFTIDPEKCNECEGTGHGPACVEVCPVEAIYRRGSAEAQEAEEEARKLQERLKSAYAASPPPIQEPPAEAAPQGLLPSLAQPIWNGAMAIFDKVPGGGIVKGVLTPIGSLLGLKQK